MNQRTSASKKSDSKSSATPASSLKTAVQPSFSSQDPLLHIQRQLGNTALQQMYKSGQLQVKLKIGAPNDKYEREADRVADHVVRMPDSHTQFSSLTSNSPLSVSGNAADNNTANCSIQRTCSTCEDEFQRQTDEEENDLIQAKEQPGTMPVVTPHIASNIHSIRGGGQPLLESSRAFFEPRFGHNFSNVRIHTGPGPDQRARAINAKAYTTGHDIVFRSGQYSPESHAGKRLLAHELTHVVQQREHTPAQHKIQREEDEEGPPRPEEMLEPLPELEQPPNVLTLDLLDPLNSSARIGGFSLPSPRDILNGLELAREFLGPQGGETPDMSMFQPNPTPEEEEAMRRAICRAMPSTCVLLDPSAINQPQLSIPTVQLPQVRLRLPRLIHHNHHVIDHITYDEDGVPPRHYVLLDQVSTQMIDHHNIVADITGHTDSHGDSGYNQRLSEQRANAVESYLTNRSVPQVQIWNVQGLGETQPAYPNDDVDWLAAARNRRVEIDQRRMVWEGLINPVRPLGVETGPDRDNPDTDDPDRYRQLREFFLAARTDIQALITAGNPIQYTESGVVYTLPMADNENIREVMRLVDDIIADLRQNRLVIRFNMPMALFGGTGASYNPNDNLVRVSRFTNNQELASVAASFVHEYLHAIQDRTAEQLLRARRLPVEHSREEELQKEIQARRVDNYMQILLEAAGHPPPHHLNVTFVHQFETIRTADPVAQERARHDVRSTLERAYTASSQLGFYPAIRYLVELRGGRAFLVRQGAVEIPVGIIPAGSTASQIQNIVLGGVSGLADYQRLFDAPDGSRYVTAFFVVVRGLDTITEFATQP